MRGQWPGAQALEALQLAKALAWPQVTAQPVAQASAGRIPGLILVPAVPHLLRGGLPQAYP